MLAAVLGWGEEAGKLWRCDLAGGQLRASSIGVVGAVPAAVGRCALELACSASLGSPLDCSAGM